MNAMLRWLFCSVGLLLPTLVHADSSLSFAPPPGDYSVVYLGNLFGIVGSVLHGNGSQIMGAMFGVFNSAVLALGGIVIMYTLLVSTMNTAHEGEMLGRKWSSIWVPMRSTLGLALLVPKTSGYCLMQIFVMWIVLQGVGAADKIWAAALSYLNRGGAIVQPQLSSFTSQDFQDMATGSGQGMADIANGAAKILLGQVCMVGIQTILEDKRQSYLTQARTAGGPCYNVADGDPMKGFCDNSVPDFLASVNAIDRAPSVQMPNFDKGSIYSSLNGICGEIKWKKFSTAAASDKDRAKKIQDFLDKNLTKDEQKTTEQSRDIAVQQMYSTLAAIAQSIVNNDPLLHKLNPNDNKMKHPTNGNQQFGVPMDSKNKFCQDGRNCVNWGDDPNANWDSGSLFHGTEFQGAISDYNGTMRATLNLIYQITTNTKSDSIRSFINDANRQGWIMAGSYFFKLAMLSTSNMSSGNLIDSDSGLATSVFDPNKITFGKGAECKDTGNPTLCTWLLGKNDQLEALIQLIDGSVGGKNGLPMPKASKLAADYKPQNGDAASTAIGFIYNSLVMQIPGQPGLSLTKLPDVQIPVQLDNVKEKTFTCPRDGELGWPLSSFCPKRDIPDAAYNGMVVPVVNVIIGFVNNVLNQLIRGMILTPLMIMGDLMQSGVAFLQNPNTNPIVALAQMGVTYINVSIGIWFGVMLVTLPFLAIPGVMSIAPVIFALMGFMTPILFAWLGVLVALGFLTAYYIPFIPYMIFTFGTLAWFIVVIEAMVAAPIVALGVTHPEGEGAFGKGEQAIMILLNVFLRPAMMIIGYVAAIALTYVSVWVMNAGFNNIASFMWSGKLDPTLSFVIDTGAAPLLIDANGNYAGYKGIAGFYSFFFTSFVYVVIYLILVQRSFSLVALLPDQVLRWIGGHPESIGKESSEWGREAEGKVSELGQKTGGATAESAGKMSGAATKKFLKDKRMDPNTGNANPPSGNNPNPPAGGNMGGGGGGGG